MYRKLDAQLIRDSAAGLAERIAQQFPASSLSRVGAELVDVAGHTDATIARLTRPHWPLRLAIAGALLLLFAVAVVVPVTISVRTDVPGISDLLQGVEAAINNVIFIAIAVFFLLTLESRPRRKRALAALHELRSLAHVIDMHQLAKDPEHALHAGSAAGAHLNRLALARYLDCCSDLLSIISKIAALYAQYLNDELVLSGVNDVQQLADGLSSRIWQKIMIIDTLALRAEVAAPAAAPLPDVSPDG